MTLAPVWRTRLYAAGGALLALWIGFAVAQEELFWPLLCLAAVSGLLLIRIQPLPIGTVLLGGALLGYVVGNRGFAQLYAAPSLPLLPAELVLLVGGTVLLVQSAFRQQLPFRRDALNFILLAWILICGARVFFDLRTYGFNAARDFATVYYAAFFFLAQSAAQDAASRRFLAGCLLLGCGILPVTNFLSQQFPMFFLTGLVLRGTPLIYYKGDLVGAFLAIGAVLFFLRFESRRQPWALVISLLLALGTVATNNRASLLGLALAAVVLTLSGRWRFAALLAGGGTFAAVVIACFAFFTNLPWEQTPLNGLYEQVVSIADPLGQRTYQGENTLSKGDNNVFRTVWWRAVIDETVEDNPWFGLGFGHDLADRFLQEYLPEAGDDFSTRSPHNILLTLFGRTGLAGGLPFVLAMLLVGWRTLRCAWSTSSDSAEIGLWCSACIILVSACFGVVLEGPMGAVVFWSLLGMANASFLERQTESAPDRASAGAADLQPAEPAGEIAASS
jgi:O-antigen ligase